MKHLKKAISLFLVLALCLCLAPAAFAASVEDCPGGESCTHAAAIGAVHYDSLQEAINAAKADDTVKLLNDAIIKNGSNKPYIAIQKTITLDLKGQTASGGYFWVYGNDGNLTVEDSNAEGTGKINGTPYGIRVSGGTGTATVTGGTVSGSTYGIVAQSGTVNVIGGTVSCTSGDGIRAEGANTTVNVGSDEGGTAKVSGKEQTYAGIWGRNGATINVKDGAEITGGDGIALAITSGGKADAGGANLNVTGGKIIAKQYHGITGNGSKGTGKVTINISDGEIQGVLHGIFHPQIDGELTVTGGTISGYTGIEMRAGTLNIPEDSTAVITGDYTIDGMHYGFGAAKNGSGSTTLGVGVAVSQHTTNADLTVNIAGGTLQGYYPLFEQDLQDADHSNVVLNVTGGNFEHLPYTEYTPDPYRGGGEDGYNVSDEGYTVPAAVKKVDASVTCEISGGTFSSDVKEYLTADKKQDANGTVVDEDTECPSFGDVAAIGNVGYTSLQKAIDAADANDTVTLLKDHAESVTVKADQSITLDLNGKTLKNSTDAQDNKVADKERKHTITNKGTLTVQGEGTVDNVSHGKAAVFNDGTITLAGGTYTRSEEKGFYNEETGKRENGGNSWYVVRNNSGTMNVQDGALIKGSSGFSSMVSNGNNFGNAVLNITGGRLESTAYVAIQNQIGCTLNISGGTVEGTGAPYCLSLYGTTNISGSAEVNGWVQVWSYDFYAAKRADNNNPIHIRSELNISGGTINDTQLQAVHGLSGYDPTVPVAELDLSKTYALWGTGDTKSLINITGGTINMEQGLLTCRITNEGGAGRGIEKIDNGGAAEIRVSGGSFSAPVPAEYCATGYVPVTNGNGTYGVGTPTPVVIPGGGTDIEDPDVPLGGFIDVTGHWALDAVNYVYEKGLMEGTSAITFEPETELTRGMLATILYRMENEPEVNSDMAYTDVASDSWYEKAVLWGTSNGLLKGYGDGTFRPEDIISREEAANLLMRYAQFKLVSTSTRGDLSAFNDAGSVSGWAEEGLSWAVGAELVSGKENNRLDPLGDSTRAEAAMLLMRYCENILK